jgi:transposase
MVALDGIPSEKRVYIDKSGVNKCLVREYGRAWRGVKVEDTKRGKKIQRTNVVAAKIGDKVVAPLCYTENTTSLLFVDWFRNFFVKVVPKGVTAIMDNARFHPKKKLRNLAHRHGIKLLFLPPYSPDYNQIEKVWANMKRALPDILNEGKTLEQAIYKYLN